MGRKKRDEIVVNGKFLLATLEGMPRVAREITAAFDELLEEEKYAALDVRVLAPKGARTKIKLKNIEIEEIGLTQGALWEQIDLPLHLHGRYCLNFTGTGPLVLRNGGVVVHDAQFRSSPRSHGWKSRLLYNAITPVVTRRYRNVVTVSDYAKAEILKYRVSARDDIKVITNSADHVYRVVEDEGIIGALGLQTRQFLLSNSSIHAHKNVPILFEAVRNSPELNTKLVLFGTATRKDFEVRGVSVPAGVQFAGRISDGQLIALMKHARMFLFPSTTEGFGLPPLEAMSLGCPTLCASAGAMPEICGSGAIYASPLDPDDWRRQIERLWNDDLGWKLLSEAGRRQASLYSWRRSAEQYLDLISNG